ncbi:3-hydroxyacyl-CoA dehydrogenase family protein [Carboxylicivirga taeanensis]|uniref:3-hydroxyacyl-CoA dehydrogenase family protein n=1 Tax=Carboxylicivirga taeanensis TaxID=1416875 RepID=UPI003F6E1E59
MSHLDRFKNISVIGAAGKMGSGILLLNVLHAAKLMHHGPYIGQTFVINAIDQNFEGLQGLMNYLKGQLQKWAEKNIVELRKLFANRSHLIDNKDIIEAFVFEALSMVKPSINMEAAYHSNLVFEAIIEDETIKASVLKQINDNNPHEPFFLTNTSAIPIEVLNQKAQLDGRIIGCHFYNPPAVQKLIEVVELKDGHPELSKIVDGFARHMNKLIVPSFDVAGFVGNGFFMREILFAERMYNDLRKELGAQQALLITDKVSHELMMRPMGIFQLVDYVGIDVCVLIMKVMNTYLDEEIASPLLSGLLEKGVRGGQHHDGSQKAGLFSYEKGRPVELYDLDADKYIPIEAPALEADKYLSVQTKVYSWNQLNRSKYREQHLKETFEQLAQEDSRGTQLLKTYMTAMKTLGLQLKEDGVTASTDYVNAVMMNGFYHLYGPVNDYNF